MSQTKYIRSYLDYVVHTKYYRSTHYTKDQYIELGKLLPTIGNIFNSDMVLSDIKGILSDRYHTIVHVDSITGVYHLGSYSDIFDLLYGVPYEDIPLYLVGSSNYFVQAILKYRLKICR